LNKFLRVLTNYKKLYNSNQAFWSNKSKATWGRLEMKTTGAKKQT
jgi:hypothetical protein